MVECVRQFQTESVQLFVVLHSDAYLFTNIAWSISAVRYTLSTCVVIVLHARVWFCVWYMSIWRSHPYWNNTYGGGLA